MSRSLRVVEGTLETCSPRGAGRPRRSCWWDRRWKACNMHAKNGVKTRGDAQQLNSRATPASSTPCALGDDASPSGDAAALRMSDFKAERFRATSCGDSRQ